MNIKNIKLCILNVILPLLAGFIYYYLFCPDVILIKKIDSILKVKYHIQIANTNFMVRFARFYLLDALWAYALTHCLFIVLGNTLTALKESFVISVVMSVTMELLQLFNMVVGTFDICDIFVEIAAVFIASIIIIKHLKGEKIMKNKGVKVLALTVCLSTFALFAMGSGSTGESTVDKEIVSATNGTSSTSSTNVDSSVETSEDVVTVEQTVLVDQDNVVITATGMDESVFGPELKLLIENNSDTNLTFQVRNASVNGYMVDTMMSEDVAAGKKSNTEITFTTSGLEECGIDTFANMEFSFNIFTTDGWDDYINTDAVTVETSAAATYTQTIDDSGEVLYDSEEIKIIGKGLSSNDSIFGPGLIIYIENNSNKDYTVQARDTSVNGFMIDTIMSQDVVAGKKAITAITFLSSSLEDNAITDITSVETSFLIFGTEDWSDEIDTEPITINF